MRRKLIKQGQNALTITVPADWVKNNDLKGGDEVEIQEDESRLIVVGKGALTEKETRLKVVKAPKWFIHNKIANAYKKGYDLIRIDIGPGVSFKTIEFAAAHLMGHALMDMSKEKAVIKNISLELEEEYPNLFRKSFYICKQNIRTILDDIKRQKYDNFEDVHDYAVLVRKYTDFVKRVINKNKGREDYAVFEYLSVWCLEKVSFELDYLYRYLHRYKPKVNKATLDGLKRSFSIFETMIDHYFKKDVSHLVKFWKEKEKFFDVDFDKLMQRSDVNHNILHRASVIMMRCEDMVGPFHGRYA
ncbi:AbrB/MazE/SpoVT family DNA-binding domain-containing protein [Nanoarchaeota archaeon]